MERTHAKVGKQATDRQTKDRHLTSMVFLHDCELQLVLILVVCPKATVLGPSQCGKRVASVNHYHLETSQKKEIPQGKEMTRFVVRPRACLLILMLGCAYLHNLIILFPRETASRVDQIPPRPAIKRIPINERNHANEYMQVRTSKKAKNTASSSTTK